jgi:hypothetical protein
MEASRTLLLASFIFKENKAGYLKYLNERFKIPIKRIFIFETTIDTTRYIVTFKFKTQRRININKLFSNTIPIHKKGHTLYTINALNKLIEKDSGLPPGNINYKSYKIDWDQYQGKCILFRDGELIIGDLKRVFP